MITDLVLLWTVGIRPVLVHGGGPEINSWLTKLGIQPEFKNGLRVTDGKGNDASSAARAWVQGGSTVGAADGLARGFGGSRGRGGGGGGGNLEGCSG